ncbi:hypothetical protein [Halorhabdus salina]|uniref:hypothetical protein n=1 Tax=Halorhabdus salina TaxID=2750670 RepID=UPI0015EFA92C|nr:hypothetical protein [Halorhabdus salina]
MAENFVENHFAVQAALIISASIGMQYAGEAVSVYAQTQNLPYAGTVGFVIGAALAFVPFALIYRRYEARYDE